MSGKRKMLTCGALRSRKLAIVSDAAERMYWRLYMTSDNYGVAQGDVFDIAGACLPYVKGWNEAKAEKALNELVKVGLVHSWECGGNHFWHIINHDKHQSKDFITRRGARKLAAPIGCECCKDVVDSPSRRPRSEAKNDTNSAARAQPAPAEHARGAYQLSTINHLKVVTPAPDVSELKPTPLVDFGKHLGSRVKALPQDYLEWFVDEGPRGGRYSHWLELFKEELDARRAAEPPRYSEEWYALQGYGKLTS